MNKASFREDVEFTNISFKFYVISTDMYVECITAVFKDLHFLPSQSCLEHAHSIPVLSIFPSFSPIIPKAYLDKINYAFSKPEGNCLH